MKCKVCTFKLKINKYTYELKKSRYFIVSFLCFHFVENTTEGITDPVDKAVYKFSNHPSILKIKDHCQNVGSFHFQKVTPDAVDREVRDLNPKKKLQRIKTSHLKFLNLILMFAQNL